MSKTNLVIVESPAKAKTIGRYLGPDYTVIASMGHIRDLPKSKLGVDLDNDFEPTYQPLDGKEAIISQLEKLAKNSKLVYLATDPDREGEAISWHLKELLKLSDNRTYRVTFNEITKKVVNESIQHPRNIDQNLVDAQQARRVLDRIVGYKLSPFLWKKIKRGLSAGRVQSVATRIVVVREREIRAFVPEEYWSIDVKLQRILPKIGDFIAHYHGEDRKKVELKSQDEVNAIIRDIESLPFVVSSVKKGKKQRQPAPPFTTSTLQQEASRKLGMTPKRTMAIAQQLYEGVNLSNLGVTGLITYMRTDSLRLSTQATDAAREFIAARYGKPYIPEKTRVYKTKSNAQDGHEAIRPSDVNITPEEIRSDLAPEQYKLYKLIWSRFLACQMSNAIFDTVSIDTTCSSHLFRASNQSVNFNGFMAVYTESKDEDEESVGVALPDLQENEELTALNNKASQHFTQPPARFTEASLIKSLEEQGIGRPSTYAPTVSTILDRYYVTKDGKSLRPTPLGEVVTELMEQQFNDIVDPSFTAKMESSLDSVESGDIYWKDIIRKFYTGFKTELENAEKNTGSERIPIPAEETDEICDICGRKMVIKMGRFGKFLSCSGWPECTYAKPIVIEMPGKCPKCGSRILKKTSRNGYTYYGCEHNREVNGIHCDFMTWNVPTAENCPVCGKTMFKASGKGQKRTFCINELCTNFLPEEERPGYRPPKQKTDSDVEKSDKKTTGSSKNLKSKSGAKTSSKTKNSTKSSTKSSTKENVSKPKRVLSEAQKAALARGREKARLAREAKKAQSGNE